MRKQNVIWAVCSVSRFTVILFFIFELNIMSHLNNEMPCGPYQCPVTITIDKDSVLDQTLARLL